MKKLLTFAAMLMAAASMCAQVTFTVKNGTKKGEGEGCEKAFDHDLNTKWLDGRDAYVILEASEIVQLTGYTFVTANDNNYYGRCPEEWEIFGSNDSNAASDKDHSSWTLVTLLRNDNVIQHADYTSYHYSINTAQAYKYYKLKIVYGDSNGTFQISEFIPSYVPAFKPSYTAIDGVGGTGNEGYKSIFDGNTSSKVCTNTRYETPGFCDYHHYFIFQRSEATAVKKYKFCTGNDYNNRDPKDWELYGMNTNGTPSNEDDSWKLIDSKTNQDLTEDRKEWQEFKVDTSSDETYNTFLLRVTKARDNGNMTQFQEFRLNDDDSGYSVLAGVGGTGNEGYAKGFDGNDNTKVCTNERVRIGSYAYWFIFKTSSDLAVSGYKFATGNDATGRDPQSWSLYGMKADSDPTHDAEWTLIDKKDNVTDFPNDRMTWVHYDVENQTSEKYNYFKLEVTKVRKESDRTVQFSEFNIDGLEVNFEDKIIAYRSMSTWGDGAAANLFDGNPGTKFGGTMPSNSNGAHITFGPASQQAVSITGYSLQTPSEGGYYDRRPKSWILYGGNNTTAPENDNDWEEIHSVTDDTLLPADYCACMYVHLDSPSKPYKYFKLKVLDTQGSTGLQIGEFTLFYNHGLTPWMELRENTAPAFNGFPTVKNLCVKRNIPADKWIGLCLPFDYEVPNGWDVREMTSVIGSGESASMMFSTAESIEAGKPYIIKTDTDVSSIEVEDKPTSTAVSNVSIDGIKMIGNIAQTTIPVGSYYINNEGLLKKLVGQTANLKGFRAYFMVDSDSNIKALNLGLDDNATDISSVEEEQTDVIYNISGQRLNKIQKGINIINGKKILK